MVLIVLALGAAVYYIHQQKKKRNLSNPKDSEFPSQRPAKRMLFKRHTKNKNKNSSATSDETRELKDKDDGAMTPPPYSISAVSSSADDAHIELPIYEGQGVEGDEKERGALDLRHERTASEDHEVVYELVVSDTGNETGNQQLQLREEAVDEALVAPLIPRRSSRRASGVSV